MDNTHGRQDLQRLSVLANSLWILKKFVLSFSLLSLYSLDPWHMDTTRRDRFRPQDSRCRNDDMIQSKWSRFADTIFVTDGPVWTVVMSLKEITNLHLPITRTDNLSRPLQTQTSVCDVHWWSWLFIDIILYTLVPDSISSFLTYFGETHTLSVSPVKVLSPVLPLWWSRFGFRT